MVPVVRQFAPAKADSMLRTEHRWIRWQRSTLDGVRIMAPMGLGLVASAEGRLPAPLASAGLRGFYSPANSVRFLACVLWKKEDAGNDKGQ
jgi:hypothetical protein